MTFAERVLMLACSAMLAGACSDESDNRATAELDPAMRQGRALYLGSCAGCHGPSGEGLAGAFPPLAVSDYLQDNREAVIRGVLYGRQGPLVVNGERYDGIMPGFGHLADAEIAAVISYVFASWGNELDPVSADDVARLRTPR